MATYIPYHDRHADLKSGLKTAGAVALGGLTGGLPGAAAGLIGGFGGVGQHYLNEQNLARNKAFDIENREREYQGLRKVFGDSVAEAIAAQGEPSVKVAMIKNILGHNAGQNELAQNQQIGENLAEQFGYLQKPMEHNQYIPQNQYDPNLIKLMALKRMREAPEGYYAPQMTAGLTREQARTLGVVDKGLEKYGERISKMQQFHQPRLNEMRDREASARQEIQQSRDMIGLLKSGKVQAGTTREQMPQWLQNVTQAESSDLYDMVSGELKANKIAGIKGKNAGAVKDAIDTAVGNRSLSLDAQVKSLQANIFRKEKELAIGKARDFMLKKYAGAPLPDDLEERIQQRAKPELDRLDKRIKDTLNPLAKQIARDAANNLKPLKPGSVRDIPTLEQAQDMFLPGETFTAGGKQYVRTETGSQEIAGSKSKAQKVGQALNIAGKIANPMSIVTGGLTDLITPYVQQGARSVGSNLSGIYNLLGDIL